MIQLFKNEAFYIDYTLLSIIKFSSTHNFVAGNINITNIYLFRLYIAYAIIKQYYADVASKNWDIYWKIATKYSESDKNDYIVYSGGMLK